VAAGIVVEGELASAREVAYAHAQAHPLLEDAEAAAEANKTEV
jgi:hypothetical protein